MSFVFATPDAVTSAAQDLAGIHSTLNEATAAASGPTTAVMAAAGDEVSAGVAALFGAFGQEYQAISAQVSNFHQQFVNILNIGAGAYVSTEVANAEAALLGAVSAPAAMTPLGAAASAISDPVGAAFGPYESLFTNTIANMQSLAKAWTTVTMPAVFQALSSQISSPQTFLTALQTGNPLPVLSQTGRAGLGFANLMQQLASPGSLSLTSLGPTGASFAFATGLPQLLAFDALGAPLNAATAAAASAGAFFDAMAAGDPLGAAAVVFGAPANVANGLLNGEQLIPLTLPLPGVSMTANVPFTGLLVPLQPITATATVAGAPLLGTVTVTGPPVGGLIPALVNYVPELFATAFTT